MSLFEKASRQKLTLATTKGSMSVNDLWDLSLPNLNTIAKSLNAKLKLEGEEDFISTVKVTDTVNQLRFDIVLHVIEVKKAEALAAVTAKDKAKARKELLEDLAGIEKNERATRTKAEVLAAINAL